MEQEMMYVQTIHRLGSFSKAAKALYMTQPALSLAVQRVENKLGAPIFDRNYKPLRLTEAGVLYLQKAAQIQLLEEELGRQIRDLQEEDRGELRICATHYINSRILPPVLKRYTAEHPAIRVEIIEAGAQAALSMVEEQAVDVSFASQRPGTEHFRHFPGFRDHVLLAVPAMHPVNHTLDVPPLSGLDVIQRRHLDPTWPTVDLARLSEVSWILLPEGFDLRMRTNAFFAQAGVTPKIAFEVEQFITSYHMARAGLGATFIYDRSIQDTSRDLCCYKLPFPQSVRHMDIILHKKRYISRAMQLFIETFQSQFPA